MIGGPEGGGRRPSGFQHEVLAPDALVVGRDFLEGNSGYLITQGFCPFLNPGLYCIILGPPMAGGWPVLGWGRIQRLPRPSLEISWP
jgi:hypothetical protein